MGLGLFEVYSRLLPAPALTYDTLQVRTPWEYYIKTEFKNPNRNRPLLKRLRAVGCDSRDVALLVTKQHRRGRPTKRTSDIH